MLLDDLVALLVSKVFPAVLCALMDTGTPLIEFFFVLVMFEEPSLVFAALWPGFFPLR